VIALFIAYVVWSDTPGLRTPPAIAYTAAGIFGAAGIALFLQAYGSERGSTVVVTLLLGGMAVVAGWMAISGRECMGTIGFFQFRFGTDGLQGCIWRECAGHQCDCAGSGAIGIQVSGSGRNREESAGHEG